MAGSFTVQSWRHLSPLAVVVIGFAPVIYSVDEGGGSVSVMVVKQYGTLAVGNSISIIMSTMDDSASCKYGCLQWMTLPLVSMDQSCPY